MSNLSIKSNKRAEYLAAHFKHSIPERKTDYLGKEHFWFFGEEVNLPRSATGRLFSEICFPIEGDLIRTNSSSVINPAHLGLSVKRREEVGLPYLPSQFLMESFRSRRVILHEGWQRAAQVMASVAVQVEGVINLNNRNDLEDFITPKARIALECLVPRLEQLQ
jgi:hypothetical protein